MSSVWKKIWNKFSFAMISFGLNIFEIYLFYMRVVEIWSEYCICWVLTYELKIHKTIIFKRIGFSHVSGTDTFLPNHSTDHHKWFTINMSFESWLGHWRKLEVPIWGLSSWSLFWNFLASWSWFGYGAWLMIHPWSEVWFSILILKV